MMEYNEEDFLNLAGIQHFAFCKRQWALIHIERQWKENLRTIEGNILHEKAHNDEITTKRNGLIITRGMPVFSRELGINGICDIVEFIPDEQGIKLIGTDKKYLPVPVEYKRGEPKEYNADELQLCAQAMCLEYMLVCNIKQGYLYYGENRHRTHVLLTNELRDEVKKTAEQIHDYYNKAYTPKVKISKRCKACSLAEICIPKLCKNSSAKEYLKGRISEL